MTSYDRASAASWPRPSELRRCTGCREAVLWVTILGSGKRMPVDPVIENAGNVAVRQDHTGRFVARVLTADDRVEVFERLTVSHLATCEKAAEFRREQRQLADNVIDLGAARRRRSEQTLW